MTTLLISDTAAYVKVRRVYIICVKELRMTEQISRSAAWKLPVFLVLGAMVVLAMLRLGIWQLGRADEKQRILDEQVSRSSQLPVALSSLDPTADDLRFRKVTLQGTLLADKTIFVDRQVVGGQVGYQVFTPLRRCKPPTDSLRYWLHGDGLLWATRAKFYHSLIHLMTCCL